MFGWLRKLWRLMIRRRHDEPPERDERKAVARRRRDPGREAPSSASVEMPSQDLEEPHRLSERVRRRLAETNAAIATESAGQEAADPPRLGTEARARARYFTGARYETEEMPKPAAVARARERAEEMGAVPTQRAPQEPRAADDARSSSAARESEADSRPREPPAPVSLDDEYRAALEQLRSRDERIAALFEKVLPNREPETILTVRRGRVSLRWLLTVSLGPRSSCGLHLGRVSTALVRDRTQYVQAIELSVDRSKVERGYEHDVGALARQLYGLGVELLLHLESSVAVDDFGFVYQKPLVRYRAIARQSPGHRALVEALRKELADRGANFGQPLARVATEIGDDLVAAKLVADQRRERLGDVVVNRDLAEDVVPAILARWLEQGGVPTDPIPVAAVSASIEAAVELFDAIDVVRGREPG